MGQLPLTDPRKTPFVELRSRGELPHLYKDGGSYFITFGLWDAVGRTHWRPPGAGEAPAPKWTEVASASEPPLQLGSCLLSVPAVADLVQSALRFFHGERYDLAAWCVMPNHVHAVVTPFPAHLPSAILHSWKSFTSHQVNKLLGRRGTLWERESFDHLIRTWDDFARFVYYVENNPVAAGLRVRPEDWPWSSARYRAT